MAQQTSSTATQYLDEAVVVVQPEERGGEVRRGPDGGRRLVAHDLLRRRARLAVVADLELPLPGN